MNNKLKTKPTKLVADADLSPLLHARRKNLRALIANRSATAVAAQMGYANTSFVSHLTHGQRSISEKTARNMEKALGLSVGWLDREDSEVTQNRIKLDVHLLAQIDQAIDKMPGGEKLPALKRAQIVSVAYDRGELDVTLVQTLVKLAQK